MNNLKLNEEIKFNSAIYKLSSWQQHYEELFIDIIPITWKTIRKLLSKISCNLLDDGDYLTVAFITYDEIISSLQNNHEIINKEKVITFDEFIRNYVIKLYNNCRKLIRELQVNKSNVLNLCNYSYDSYLINEKQFIYDDDFSLDIYESEAFSRINQFFKDIKSNNLWAKVVYLKIEGLNNKEVANKLTLSETKICRTIKQLKKYYQMMVNKQNIERIKIK